jgi:hypothetical protein
LGYTAGRGIAYGSRRQPALEFDVTLVVCAQPGLLHLIEIIEDSGTEALKRNLPQFAKHLPVRFRYGSFHLSIPFNTCR